MSLLKETLLFLYWFPAIVRVLWRQKRGRYFFLRDESDDFLRYLCYAAEILDATYPEQTGLDGSVAAVLSEAIEESAARQRRRASADANADGFGDCDA